MNRQHERRFVSRLVSLAGFPLVYRLSQPARRSIVWKSKLHELKKYFATVYSQVFSSVWWCICRVETDRGSLVGGCGS